MRFPKKAESRKSLQLLAAHLWLDYRGGTADAIICLCFTTAAFGDDSYDVAFIWDAISQKGLVY